MTGELVFVLFCIPLFSSPDVRSASERILTQHRITEVCCLLPCLTVNLMFSHGYVKPLRRAKETVNGETRNRLVCKQHQLLVCFLPETSCALRTVEVRARVLKS